VFDAVTAWAASSTNTATTDHITEELAHRTCNGFDVFLVCDRVEAPTGSSSWTAGASPLELPAREGRQALERFYHPFVYATAA
jgi:hypothetical protein